MTFHSGVHERVGVEVAASSVLPLLFKPKYTVSLQLSFESDVETHDIFFFLYHKSHFSIMKRLNLDI